MYSRGGLRQALSDQVLQYPRLAHLHSPIREHRFTTLDDFSEISLARLSADGFKHQ
jgi:hypothetical protein